MIGSDTLGTDRVPDLPGNTTQHSGPSVLSRHGDFLPFNYNELSGLSGFAGSSALLDGWNSAGAPDSGKSYSPGSEGLPLHTNGTAGKVHAQFVYNVATGTLGLDADGTRAGSAVQVAMIGVSSFLGFLNGNSMVIEG